MKIQKLWIILFIGNHSTLKYRIKNLEIDRYISSWEHKNNRLIFYTKLNRFAKLSLSQALKLVRYRIQTLHDLEKVIPQYRIEVIE